jgi:type II secretory pathway pseudopilin PulG
MKGYTLVETLIYAALLVVILSAVVTTTIMLSTSYRAVKSAKNTENAALSAMDQMTRNIRSASIVNGTQTYYNATSGSLLLDSGVRFYLSGNQVMEDKSGTVFGPLTESVATVNSLVFRPLNTGNSTGVKIEMNIDGKNFYNTVMLRGSYQ